jgi:very-short-patch-repair endonuclease
MGTISYAELEAMVDCLQSEGLPEHKKYFRAFHAMEKEKTKTRARLLQRLHLFKSQSHSTRAEVVMEGLLIGLGIPNRPQQGLIGRTKFIIPDFYLSSHNTVVEVDGGYHDTPKQKRRDCVKDAIYERRGLRVMRFKNEEVLCNPLAVVNRLIDTLHLVGWT